MKTISIWLDNPLNDATSFYVDLLEQSMSKAGFRTVRFSSPETASKADFVITLHAKATCQILRHNPRAKVITWYQGIVPEEAMLWQGKRLPNRMYKLAWELFEIVALRMSCLCVFVSDAMHVHYRQKYHFGPKAFQVIPCFNKALLPAAFNYGGKYTTPSFVYAGGLDRWQCIDEMLTLFAKIQKKIPAASLTILSSQQALALELLAKYSIQNGKVSYVPLAEVEHELQKYKYGFLLRAEHPINNVATPTKMNTYLSCGIIPIYTSAIRDFETRLGNLPYSIKAKHPLDEEVISSVIKNEKHVISAGDLLESYEAAFASYYSADKYIAELAEKIRKLS